MEWSICASGVPMAREPIQLSASALYAKARPAARLICVLASVRRSDYSELYRCPLQGPQALGESSILRVSSIWAHTIQMVMKRCSPPTINCSECFKIVSNIHSDWRGYREARGGAVVMGCEMFLHIYTEMCLEIFRDLKVIENFILCRWILRHNWNTQNRIHCWRIHCLPAILWNAKRNRLTFVALSPKPVDCFPIMHITILVSFSELKLKDISLLKIGTSLARGRRRYCP